MNYVGNPFCEVYQKYSSVYIHKEASFPWNSTLASIHTLLYSADVVAVFIIKSNGVLWNKVSHQSSINVAHVSGEFLVFPSFYTQVYLLCGRQL